MDIVTFLLKSTGFGGGGGDIGATSGGASGGSSGSSERLSIAYLINQSIK